MLIIRGLQSYGIRYLRRSYKEKKIDLISILKDKQLQNCEVYDPWTDKWIIPVVTEDEVYLPDFKRSLVLRFTIK